MQTKILSAAALCFLMMTLFTPLGFAAMQYNLNSGLELDWYFPYEDASWKTKKEIGYFRDYNSDGIPDFLFHQTNNTDKDRIFCIDTSNSAVPKNYSDDRTAWKEITWSEGTFIPASLHTVKPGSEKRTPDIILRGRDKEGDYTKFILKRLDETKTDFEQQLQWSHNVDRELLPSLVWASQSFNQDDYPDYLIFNARLNAQNKFFIGCYDGLNGTEIWSKSIDKATDDPGGSPPFPGITPSTLTLSVIPSNSEINQTGDFDSNGKSEILLFYTFTLFDAQSGFTTKGKVLILKSDGNTYTSTPSWWEVYSYPIMMPIFGTATWDYNEDTYVDLALHRYMDISTADIPVLQVFDLKNAAELFKTTNSDFGAETTDKDMFFSTSLRGINNAFQDIDNDSHPDLAFYRIMGMPGNPMRYGVFHSYDGGEANKGRKIWLQEAADFDTCLYPVTDWNGDDILDFALAKSPTDLVSQNFTWNFSLPYIQLAGPIIKKAFSYDVPYTGAWNASTDVFSPASVMMAMVGDVDGDSQQDTYGSVHFTVDNGDDGNINTAGASVFLFDNTPGSGAPDITAEFTMKVTNEDIAIPTIFFTAYDTGKEQSVDQNKDGSPNDICICNDRALFALSFLYKPYQGITANDILQVLIGNKEIPEGKTDEYDTNDDGIVDIADVIYLLLNPSS